MSARTWKTTTEEIRELRELVERQTILIETLVLACNLGTPDRAPDDLAGVWDDDDLVEAI